MKWLYPYDGTVFPRGTAAPVLMWDGDSQPDAVYLRIRSRTFDYKGVLRPAEPEAVANALSAGVVAAGGALAVTRAALIPADVWRSAGEQSLGKGDPFQIELTERANGQVRGPIVLQITIARAGFKGSIYYSTCLSVEGLSADGATTGLGLVYGRMLRIPPGGSAKLVLTDNECQGCHSVSANGSRLITQRVPPIEDLLASVTNPNPMAQGQGMSYVLNPDGTTGANTARSVGPEASYGALYPDGSKYLSMATPGADAALYGLDVGLRAFGFALSLPSGGNPIVGAPATLHDTTTGEIVPDTGIPEGALMATFSPDGTRLVFNDLTIDVAHGLAVMDYDVRGHKASRYAILTREAGASALRPGWPFFLPDNKAVVFVRTDAPTFSSGTSTLGTLALSNVFQMQAESLKMAGRSELYIADVSTGSVTILARAMGYNTAADAQSDRTYLPFPAEDLHHSYFPTVSPVAGGGYFWVFFDSVRHFGQFGLLRGIWGFAIDVRTDGSYTADPSHPPFFLPGQEFLTSVDNHRAFAALDACRPDSTPCSTGIDCCSGACANDGACAPLPPNTCAERDERCASAADCCDKDNLCINGFCAFVELF